MSEFTAVGPAEAHDGLRPRRPRHSLLETEGVLVTEDATRILNGVNVLMYPTGCSELWEPCSDGTFRTKNDDSTQLNVRFDSFVVYKALTCSTISVGGGERADEWAARAERVLDATLSAGVERALAEGVEGSSNPFFGDANVDVLGGGTAVSPSVALSYLEEAIGASCRQGMLHFTPGAVAGLQAFPLEGGADNELITANGTPVVSGDGYIGVDTPWLTSPGTGESWAFATGRVQVHLGPMVSFPLRESLDREENITTFRAEKYALAIWDGIDTDELAAAAVLVDWAA
jgi:hypothetical protein